jgi:hypothetical protein
MNLRNDVSLAGFPKAIGIETDSRSSVNGYRKCPIGEKMVGNNLGLRVSAQKRAKCLDYVVNCFGALRNGVERGRVGGEQLPTTGTHLPAGKLEDFGKATPAQLSMSGKLTASICLVKHFVNYFSIEISNFKPEMENQEGAGNDCGRWC